MCSEYRKQGAGGSAGSPVEKRPLADVPKASAEQRMYGKIIFIDETAGFMKSKRFAKRFRGADNYVVLITRDDLNELPYSADEIYGLRNVSDAVGGISNMVLLIKNSEGR